MHRSIHPAVFVVVVIVAIVATAAVTTKFLPWWSARGGKAKLGQSTLIDGLALTVTDPRQDAGQPPLTAPPGHTYQIVTVSIQNVTANSVQIIPLLQFHLKDASGQVYNVTVGPTRGEQLSGPLGPNETLREEIAFQVPLSARNLRLLFEPGQTGQHVLTIPLT